MGSREVTSMPHPVFDKLHLLNGYQPQPVPMGDRRPAAVLVPVIRRQTRQLIYTMRSQQLKQHPGQISFPGGRIDDGESPQSAAVREAWEEVGLPPDAVEVLGEIDQVYSPRGYHIRCFVGLCDDFEPVINHSEVESLVEVGLDELFDEGLHTVQPWQNRQVHSFAFQAGNVWGVTGHITWRLREILKNL